MKALIVEIKRKYCIIITPDGRFLKKAMPAGNYEIGDEVLIDENDTVAKNAGHKFSFGMPAKIAAGFAVAAILVTGAYFGARYIGSAGSAAPMVASAPAEVKDTGGILQQDGPESKAETGVQDFSETQAEKSIALEEGADQKQEETAAGTENADTENTAAAGEITGEQQDNETGSGEKAMAAAASEYPLLFEVTYSLDATDSGANIYIPAGFADLDISYMVEKYTGSGEGGTDGPGILWLQIKNIFDNMYYNGNIKISFFDEANNLLDTKSIDFISFGTGSTRLEKIYFGKGYVAFSIMVFGEIK